MLTSSKRGFRTWRLSLALKSWVQAVEGLGFRQFRRLGDTASIFEFGLYSPRPFNSIRTAAGRGKIRCTERPGFRVLGFIV